MMRSPLGKIFFFSFMTHWGTCVDSTHKRGFINSMGKFSLQLLWGLSLCLRPVGSPFMILYFIGNLVDGLNHRGVSLLVSNLPRDVLNAFNPLRNFLRVFVSFT